MHFCGKFSGNFQIAPTHFARNRDASKKADSIFSQSECFYDALNDLFAYNAVSELHIVFLVILSADLLV